MLLALVFRELCCWPLCAFPTQFASLCGQRIGACFLMSGGDADGVDDAQGGVPLPDRMPLWNLVCPITNAIFEDPVVASDGRTYSKAALLAWLASRNERKLSVTSPFGDTITENFSPNERMAAAIHKYRKQRTAAIDAGAPDPPRPGSALALAEIRCGGGALLSSQESSAAAQRAAASPEVKSIAELGRMFALLDDLRELLYATLDGWQPPQLVVVGEESSGKSSVLERLMMTPLLPRADNICTRLPIHVRLRRSGRAEPPKLEVFNVKTNTPERGPYTIAAQSGAADVSEEMGRIIREEQGALKGVSASRIIILHISSPEVPFLDLIDMPGLVTAPSGDEPSDMARQTEELVKEHIQSKHGINSLYLAIVKATSAPNTSNAMKLLNEAKLYGKTFGVFTFCDYLNPRSSKDLKHWVRNGQDKGAVVLEPYGW